MVVDIVCYIAAGHGGHREVCSVAAAAASGTRMLKHFTSYVGIEEETAQSPPNPASFAAAIDT